MLLGTYVGETPREYRTGWRRIEVAAAVYVGLHACMQCMYVRIEARRPGIWTEATYPERNILTEGREVSLGL